VSDANEANIAKALGELTKARVAYADAETAYKAASSKKTAATNRLSEAQKAFDKATDAVRESAPWDTNWHRRKNKGGVCEAP
jgi:uncharacterized protein HemY